MICSFITLLIRKILRSTENEIKKVTSFNFSNIIITLKFPKGLMQII